MGVKAKVNLVSLTIIVITFLVYKVFLKDIYFFQTESYEKSIVIIYMFTPLLAFWMIYIIIKIIKILRN